MNTFAAGRVEGRLVVRVLPGSLTRADGRDNPLRRGIER